MANKDFNETQQLDANGQWDSPEYVERPRSASFRPIPVSGPQPIAPIPEHVQLTPIVQPVAFVPYSSQAQPLFTFDSDGSENTAYYDNYANSQGYSNQDNFADASTASEKKKKTGGTSTIFLILIIIAACVISISQFVASMLDFTYIVELDGEKLAGAGLIQKLTVISFEDIMNNNVAIFALLAIVTSVCFGLCLIVSLFNFTKGGAPLFTKLLISLALITTAGMIIWGMTKSLTLGYGAYILVVIALVLTIIAWFTKRYIPEKTVNN